MRELSFACLVDVIPWALGQLKTLKIQVKLEKNNIERANFTRIFKVLPKLPELREHLKLLFYHIKSKFF